MNESLSTKDAKKLAKASVLSTSDDPKDQDRARARQTDVDYKDLVRQLKAKRKKKMKESFVLEREDSPYEKASSGALAGKTRSSGASKTEPKTGFGRKAHRNSAAMIIRAKRKAERSGKKLSADSAAELAHRGWASSVKHHKDSMTPEQRERRNKLAKTKYKDLSKDEQDKDKVSAKAIMSVHDKQKKKKTNESVGFTIDTPEHNKAKKKSKLRNLARGNENPAEKKAAERKAGGPKLYGEASYSDTEMLAVGKGQGKPMSKEMRARADAALAHHSAMRKKQKEKMNEGKSWDSWKKAAANALKKKKEERKAQPATDAGARARQRLKDKEHNKYVSFLPAEPD